MVLSDLKLKEWEKIPIPPEVQEHNYTLVASRLKGKTKSEKVIIHASCRANFRNKIGKFKERYKNVNSQFPSVDSTKNVEHKAYNSGTY